MILFRVCIRAQGFAFDRLRNLIRNGAEHYLYRCFCITIGMQVIRRVVCLHGYIAWQNSSCLLGTYKKTENASNGRMLGRPVPTAPLSIEGKRTGLAAEPLLEN